MNSTALAHSTDFLLETRRAHLCRLAAILGGATGLTGCVAKTQFVSPVRPSPDRPVRIGLKVGESAVRIAARGRVVVESEGARVLRLGGEESVNLAAEGSMVRVGGSGDSQRFDAISFRPVDDSSFVVVDGLSFRGDVSVSVRDDGLTVVNEVGLEDYVQGVVAAEIGPLAEGASEALKAQAVAARTYVMVNLGRFERQGFDVWAGVSDQAYRGSSGESPEGNRAVSDTRGLVLTHDGDPVTIFYHSTCGFATAEPPESFRDVRPRPYLRSVSDRRSGGYYCDRSPRFRWTVAWDQAELRGTLQATLPRLLGIDASMVSAVHDVVVRRMGASGRVAELRIRVDGGEIPVFGPDLRGVFVTPQGGILGSTAVQISTTQRDGLLARLTAAGAGWGHGVGLCQWGAIGRAHAGHDYGSILGAYFPGTSVERWRR